MSKKVDPRVLIDYLKALDDPRIDRTRKHELIDILVIAICATICGAKTWIDIEDFGKSKKKWFSSFLNLKHGIPSHDTFRRIFILLNPEKFLGIFISWVKSVTKDVDLEQICIDGKTLRKSFDKGKHSSAIHMINAWSTGSGLALGQLKSESKKNEINTVPKLLEYLDIEGCIVSADAMNCQVKIAEKVLEKGGDYLLGLKGNQKYLEKRVKEKFNEIQDLVSEDSKIEIFESYDEGHGRVEKRTCTVISEKEGCSFGINVLEKWSELKSVIKIQSERTSKKTGEVSEETRFYISSFRGSAEKFLKSVRGHWEVENKLHWVMDVIFREDECRSRAGHSGENFSLLRQFALNLIKLEPGKKAIRRKQNLAGWDESFLIKIITAGGQLDA